MIFQGMEFDDRTNTKVLNVIAEAKQKHMRIEILYGDVRDPSKEPIYTCRGTIGKSVGTLPIPLLIKTCRSLGGDKLKTTGIILIREILPRGKRGKILYSRQCELNGIAQ